ncbi:MAG: DUF1576 domain-containing protein [Oscillibacter sp.]|nr:DUF1576 domain-containing protein [Oscillibacter sp.]
MPHTEQRFDKIFPATIAFSAALVILGLLLDDPAKIPQGLYNIITMQDLLITDYVYIAGPGAALINAALVTVISISIIRFTGDPYNGFTIVEVGLMAGFSLFGKNVVNIWPIIFGTWLYARYQREPFAKYASVALLATSLAPMVSYMALGSVHASLPLGAATGILIGFVLPSLSAYTYKVQNGMNLYNMGFACGLFAMMTVPLMTAAGDKPDSALYWATGYNFRLSVAIGAICVLCILVGFFGTKLPVWAVWAGYRRLLSTTGRAPSDYLRMFGSGPVLVNIGVNGFISIAYVLLVGGDLNGPTLGGIFTIMGFSAFGKHAMNIIPVMLGIALGGACSVHTPAYPSLQLAGLFGTTLAPIAGHFGWPAGILAGFIHSGLVLQTGGPVAGLNLYNNGFSGGLIAIVLYPTITAIWKHRRPTLRDEDYYDLFEETAPIDTSFLHKEPKGVPHTDHEAHPEHHSIWDTPESLLQEDDAPEGSELHISTDQPAGELEYTELQD